MNRLSILVFAVLATACTIPSEQASNTPSNPSLADLSNFQPTLTLQFDTNLTYKKLRLVPITADAQSIAALKGLDTYLNLKEGLRKRAIRIQETGASSRSLDMGPFTGISSQNSRAEVNKLVARNSSKDTVFVMAGEVVTGGKQDRVVSEDFALYPGQQQDIGVFCVEQNRWTSRNGSMAFTGHFGMISNSVRHTMVTNQSESAQTEVWNEVESVTRSNRALSSTRSYGQLGVSRTYKKRTNAYFDHFINALERHENVVGLIAISGDQILGCDVFYHPGLYARQQSLLLQSYVTEAISFGDSVSVNALSIQEYFDEQLNNLESLQSRGDNWQKFKDQGVLIHFASF